MTKETTSMGAKKRTKGAKKWAHIPVGGTIVIRGKNGKEMAMTKLENGKVVPAKGNNGGGRTPGSRNINTKITDILREVLMNKTFKTQSGEDMLAVDALVEAVVRRAISKSDLLAMAIMERVDGKVSGETGTTQPIQMVQVVVQRGDRGTITPIEPGKET